MANLILPSRRVVQPQSAVDCPGADLVCVPSSNRGFTPYSGAQFIPTEKGIAWSVQNESFGYGYTSNALKPNSDITILAVVRFNSFLHSTFGDINNGATIYSQRHYSGDASPSLVASSSYYAGNGTVKLWFGSDIGAVGRIHNTALSTGRWYVIAATAGNVASSIILAIDGVSDSTVTNTVGSYNTSWANEIAYLGYAPQWQNTGNDIDVALLVRFPFYSDSRKLEEWTRNPWKIFAPQKRRVYFDVGASGGVSLTTDGLSQTQTLENTILIQQNTLGINSLSSSQTLSTFALIQNNNITLDNVFNLQTLENTSLSADSSVIVGNILQVQTLDNISILQNNVLSTNVVFNSQVLDNIGLIQQNTLNIDNTSNLQALEGIELAVSGYLGINNAYNAQSVESVNLTQNNTLVLNSTLDQQSLDNINLTQSNTLSTNSLGNSQGLDNIIINTQLYVVPNNISNTQPLENIALTQSNIIALNSIFNTHSLENIILTQSNTLSVSSLDNSQIIGIISLDSSYNLLVDSFTSLQSLDSLLLESQGVLNINGISNNQLLGNIALNQSNILNINNLLSSTSLTTTSLFIGTVIVEVSGGLVFILKENIETFIKDPKNSIFVYKSNSDR